MPIKGLPGGDFAGCVKAMSGEMDNPQAFCAWKTHELTGEWPTEEAMSNPDYSGHATLVYLGEAQNVDRDPDYSGHAMIALKVHPDIANKMAIEGGTPADELHLTLVYLGEAQDVDRDAVLDAITPVIEESPAIHGHVGGMGYFTQIDEDDKHALVGLYDSPQLPEFRQALVDALGEAKIVSPSDHGFTPHITLAYVPADDHGDIPDVYGEPFAFEEVFYVHGDEWNEIPFPLRGRESFDLHETIHASLTVREGKAPNTVLLDGVLICEGESDNGNIYSLAALRTAPAVFAKKPIRINHPSRSEDRDRPEGDLYTQVGKMPTEDGFKVVQRDDGVHEVKFFGAVLSASPPDIWIADRVRAGIIGDMSINAGGEGVKESSGKFQVDRFTMATSHDLVTQAAAGGKTTALHESKTDGGDTVDKDKKKVVVNVDGVMESVKLAPEFRPLVEAYAQGLLEAEGEDEEEKPKTEAEEDEKQEAEGEDEDQKKEAAPEFLADLPEPLRNEWTDAYSMCMEGEGAAELACGHLAWYTVVMGLIPAETEAEDEDEMTESVTAYAKKLKAAMSKMPGVGRISGMGSGRKQKTPPAEPTATREQRVKESFEMIPGMTKEMAEIAARGR